MRQPYIRVISRKALKATPPKRNPLERNHNGKSFAHTYKKAEA